MLNTMEMAATPRILEAVVTCFIFRMDRINSKAGTSNIADIHTILFVCASDFKTKKATTGRMQKNVVMMENG